MGLNLIVFVYLATIGVHDKLTTQLKDQLNTAGEDEHFRTIIFLKQPYPYNDSTYWYRSDWNLIKPDLSAPGVSVRTCWNNHQYTTITGTSFSCAHATGAVAILLEKKPDLTVTEVYNILLNNADRPLPGAPYPNNNYGWGRLNIWKAVQSLTGIAEKESAKNCLVDLHIASHRIRSRITL